MRTLPACLLLPVLSLGVVSPVLAADYVCLETNFGEICLEMLPEAAPLTVANFLEYVDAGDYDNTLVHYSYSGGLFQGGGYYGDPYNFGLPIRANAPIVNESGGHSNLRGTVAMARNAGYPDSASNQWFINLTDNTDLDTTWDGGFTVFARIVQGIEVADLIGNLPVGDFSLLLGYAFTSTPVDIAPDDEFADLEDFVLVERAYRTRRHPAQRHYECLPDSPGDTLTEFCGYTMIFPVEIAGALFEATLVLESAESGLIFRAPRELLTLIEDTGQERAHYVPGELQIPSVRTPGGAFVDIRLEVRDINALTFELTAHTRR